jgi:tetratricopeptide (TPR) repeat protein/tRNA A-37 threonylcarbamoyl transferase component Bud32
MLGEHVGSYEILEEIGKGGMATVYRARQASVERDVAVKAIRRAVAADADAIQRFQREAKLIARLEHPHILPVYDFDAAHDPPFLVMRYLDSGTLDDVLEQGRLPLDEVAYLMRQVCSALDYAHRQGIVHRDIKPSNIMIDQEGNAFVSDLGIARIVSDSGGRQITETGAIIGTPEYMSPEQAQGRDDVDGRADIYSMGIMLFQMLTGRLPFSGGNPMSLLLQHIHDPVPSLTALNPDVPAAVEAVVARALAKDRDQRYAGALELSTELSAALGGAIAAEPSRLREAAHTSIILRRGGRVGEPTSTPSEQNRQVTALYANAAEYASLVEAVAGGEASRRAMNALWESLVRIIQGARGRVMTRSDTDLLAVWGAEAAGEDDAIQAVHAALDLQQTLRSLGAAFLGIQEDALPLNIGVHSGVVLLTPSDSPGQYSASGATISLANRLMQNAPGLILVTLDTYRQIRGVFDIQPDVPLRLRGRSEPVPTYRVLQAKPRAFRVTPRGVEGVATGMIGREAELKHLQNAFFDAFEEGERRVVTISGEAGVGKSRLLYEFAQWGDLRPERYFIFRGRGTPEARERPYALLRDIIAYRLEILENDPPDAVLRKLEAGVAELRAEDGDTAALLGHLCGYDLSASPILREMQSDPAQLADVARARAVRIFTSLAQRENVSFQLEDLHHADDASLDFFNDLFRADEGLHLLAVCVARPDLFRRRPDWGSGQVSHTRLELKPLDRRESRDLVHEILQKVDQVPKGLRDLLVERAEGNPYYLEELVKMLIDDHVILREDEEHWRVEEARLGALQVPPTLFGLLETRFDTLLPPEKLVLQRAAVFGRIFYDHVLETMDEADDTHVTDLPAVLATLAKREFIFHRETSVFAGNQEYIFGQAMLRDTIYDRLLERQLRVYHRAAAAWLVSLDRGREFLPLIADHYEKAGMPLEASQALRQAGDQARSHGLVREAVQLYQRALAQLPDGDDPGRLSLLMALGGAANDQADLPVADRVLQEALDLSMQLEDIRAQAEAHYQFSLLDTYRGQYEPGLAHLDQALPLAKASGDRAMQANVLYGLANTRFRAGQLEAAAVAAEESIAMARALDDNVLLATALNRLGTRFETQGKLEVARGYYEQGLDLARRIGNRRIEQALLHNIGNQMSKKGDWPEAIRYLEMAEAVAHDVGDLFGAMLTSAGLAQGYLRTGDTARGKRQVETCLRFGLRGGSEFWLLLGVLVLGELMIARGDVVEGLAAIDLVRKSAAMDHDLLNDTHTALSFWTDRLKLTPEELQQAQATAANLDVHSLIDKALQEGP